MKTKLLLLTAILIGLTSISPIYAKNVTRNVPSFSEISLRIPATVFLKQGKKQHVEILANESVVEKIITEVKDRKLVIHFPKRTLFQKNFKSGNILINITVPEVDGLFVSGSGDIVAKNEIESRILDLAISGSGDINLAVLDAERLKAAISGSGDITIKDGGVANEFNVSISGSGDVHAGGFEAHNVKVATAGSGNTSVHAIDNLKVSIAGSGNVYYSGTAAVDAKVAGSGNVKKR